MGMSRDEIINFACQYVSKEEMTDFPYDGDLFGLLVRTTSGDKILSDDEGWEFCYYAVCLGYTVDEEEKPRGKWVIMHLASLEVFPPTGKLIKLQPPHVVKSKFENHDRTFEIRLVKLDLSTAAEELMKKLEEARNNPEPEPVSVTKGEEKKIVQFRRKQPK